ncbi:ornithine cyclodeaminase [Demequina activiva]|uniref:Ornithine cyclodeaminase n=1 Tax=Demequina activiva TaxID=1582364 RepID=A0A919UFH7_9MICO|nr:ornithine cyclodeaminase [Demequina activiva]GIG53682.1 ornithine cyclodeaminase [Demequina activiva]
MVQFVGVPQMRRWVSTLGAEAIIASLMDTVQEDLTHWRRFDKIPRIASHSPVGVIELMPTSDGAQYAFKYVNGHPSNPARGLQTVTAFGVLSDVATGYPLLVSEMTILTALRTAATSGVAARALARPGSRRLALIGAGSQAEFQALGMKAALGIDQVAVWDTDPAALEKFERNMHGLGLDVRVASSAADAVAGADVVTTCTADKTNATVLTADMVEPGMHINAIGGDCPGKTELDAAILHDALIAVEFEPQTRIEGEIQQLEASHPVTALWDVLNGDATGRTSDAQVTVFDSVGFAMEDFSALRFVRAAVAGTEFVEDIDIIADPSDPKDLFSMAAAPVSLAL